MLTKEAIKAELIHQLALEYNCTPEDFLRADNVITAVSDHPDRRKYTETPPPFAMVTLGGNAVISAHPCLHDPLRAYVSGKSGIWLFEHRHLVYLDSLLAPMGYGICQTSHMFLPESGAPETGAPETGASGTGAPEPEFCSVRPDFEVRWYEQAEIAQFYGDKRFPNAFCDRFHPERPDVLAAAAVCDGEIVGMAGCSADTPTLWQIGIDVDPRYRQRNIGKTLVGLIKNEVFRRGAIPFYGTSLSNLPSWKIALGCGFRPAWVELYLNRL